MAAVARVVSFVAYLILIALLSEGSRIVCLFENLRKNRREWRACLLLLPLFLFVPAAALPAFVNMDFSAAAVFISALLSIWIYEGKLTFAAALFSASAVCFMLLMYIALNFGFPGTIFSFDMISAVSGLKYLPPYGKIMAILSCSLLLGSAAVFVKKNGRSVFVRLFVLFCCAVAVSCVLSADIALICAEYLTGAALYAAGFVCFWSAVLLFRKVVLFLSV